MYGPTEEIGDDKELLDDVTITDVAERSSDVIIGLCCCCATTGSMTIGANRDVIGLLSVATGRQASECATTVVRLSTSWMS